MVLNNNEPMLSVHPARERNVKSGNLLPLILRNLIFVIFAISIHKNTEIKRLAKKIASETYL